jgi:hypothetical protein
MPGSREGVTVRLTFKSEKDALDAVRKFDKQVADGRELSVSVVGGSNTSLSGRMGVGILSDSGSVDALLPSSSGSSYVHSPFHGNKQTDDGIQENALGRDFERRG